MTKEEKELRIKYAKNPNNKHFYKKGIAILSISYLIIFVFGFAIIILLNPNMSKAEKEFLEEVRTYRIKWMKQGAENF